MTSERLELRFPMELVKEPIIYRIGRDFGVVTNIRRADVTAQGGWLICELTGPEHQIKAAVAYIEGLGVKVSPVHRDIVE